MILLIGNKDDPHIQAIQKEITLLGKVANILDTSREGLLNTTFSFLSENRSFEIIQGEQNIDSCSIKAIFCISPMYARKGFSTTQEKDFWYFTWRSSLYGFFTELEKKSYFVNQSIPNAVNAQSKITFFEIAEQAEIPTPKSLISNDKREIISFLNSHQEAVIKTMHQIYLEHNGQQTMMLVTEVQASQFDAFETLGECPVFLQEKINKVFDLRVILVGDKVFACKIDASRSIHGNLDWRAYDLPNTVHSIFNLPNEITEKLQKVMKGFGLDYACLDLCVDDKGEFWLLDVNPFGKYMWIEMATGLKISKAIAEFLISKLM